MKKVVLIGAGGAGSCFSMVSRLKANWGDQLEIIITDINDPELVTASLLADKYCKVPMANSNDFEKIIERIIVENNVDTYIPLLNEEIVVAQNIKKKYEHIDVWSNDIYAQCVDKEFADSFLVDIGIRTPKKVEVTELKDLTTQFFMKPRNGFGSKGAQICTMHDLKINKIELNDYIFQEICSNPEITIDSFYDYELDIGYAYCRERIEVKSGVCTKARIFVDDELTGFAQIIAKAIKQKGIICFQAMKTNDGWAITDLNLRHGAGTALTCAAGFDVLAAAYACRNNLNYEQYLRPMLANEEIIVTRQYSEFVMKVTS